MQHTRTTALLAVVRIVSVLGMAFAIAWGIFMLLGAWWLPALLSFLAFLPFFFVMRFLERYAAAQGPPPEEVPAEGAATEGEARDEV
jgi:fatty acid desaturase